MTSKRTKFLQNIRECVCSLPKTIRKEPTMSDEDYYKYSQTNIAKAFHLSNQIRCYIMKYYGEGSVLYKEYMNYSFFPKGFILDPYHIDNDKFWAEGRRDNLIMLDKLTDYANAEDQLSFTEVKTLLYKLAVLVFVSVCVFLVLFVKEIGNPSINIFVDGYISKSLLFIIVVLGTSLFLWLKEWRTLLPLLVTFIALYVTMLFTLNGKI